ncbi:MAG: zinc ribbon domain-containing protein [Gammaproteobacteria bacterium]|nr:MAG: zinc ribbon domain-containing protein [Gammaproteobacteria bacterium]
MPIYEYQCHGCGHHLEVMQKLSDTPLRKCPVCGKMKLRKQISAAVFRLKGGGWYETDFKTGGKKNVHKADNEKASASKKPARGADACPSSSD